MKKLYKLIFFVLILSISLTSLSGCSSNKNTLTDNFKLPKSYEIGNSGIVVKNNNYSLSWDNEMGSITLTDLKTNVRFGTTPPGANDNGFDEFGFPILASPAVNSPIALSYVNPETQEMENVVAYSGCISRKNMVVKNIENGICVIYYFEDEHISVPVNYILRENGLKISVDPQKIGQGKKRIAKISLAPFLCSVKNNAKDSYLFVPSGCGSLIYPKVSSSSGTVYSEKLYGRDVTMQLYDSISNTENLLLPVYGVKNGNSAMTVIIEQGAEQASLEGTVGAEDIGYSNVGAEFTLLGFDRRVAVGQKKQSLSYLYAKDMNKNEISIGVYPLAGDKANYCGMAETYRDFLSKNNELKDKKADNYLHFKFLGGVMTNKSFLGIPYKRLYELTTLNEVKGILTELTDKTSQKFSVELNGYGNTGLTVKKLAGNYRIANSLGSKSQLNDLQNICKKNKNDLYFDFDLISIGKSGNGWSFFNDLAVGPTGLESYQYGYSTSVRSRDTKLGKYGLLSRKLIPESAKKLIDKTEKWNLSGIGITSLSNVCYSDYESKKYYACANMANDVKKMMQLLHDNKLNVLSNSANSYAACHSDEITDVPLQSSKHDAFDVEIPFYQIVFSGYKNLTSSSINTSNSPQHSVLFAMEGGCGLSYTIINNYNTELISSQFDVLHRSLYSDIKKDVFDTVNSTADFYSKISGAKIKQHSIINNDVRKTVFDNGTVLYVNYGSAPFTTEFGVVEAMNFIVGEER